MQTHGDNAENKENKVQDDSKIQAFAKLDFPTFTFYLKTLSVTIGRRPPQVVLPNVSAPITTTIGHDFSPRTTALTTSATRSTSPAAPFPPASDAHSPLSFPSVTPADLTTSNLATATATDLSVHKQDNSNGGFHVDVDLGPIKAVSRDHARLYYDYNLSRWALEVRGRNGVVVEGKWRARGEIVPMRPKTRIQIAERIFYFVLPEGSYSPDHLEHGYGSSEEEGVDVSLLDDDMDDDQAMKGSLTDSDVSDSSQDSYVYAKAPQGRGSTSKRIFTDAPKRTKRSIRRPAHLEEDYAMSQEDYDYAPGKASGTARQVLPPRNKLSETRGAGKKPGMLSSKSRRASYYDEASDPDIDDDAEPEDEEAAPSPPRLEKPPYSYPSLVAQAIDNAPVDEISGFKKLTSAAICEWISSTFVYYKQNPDGLAWPNSIQQALSNNRIFLKVPRRQDEPGKGNFWRMDPKDLHMFDGQHLHLPSAKEMKEMAAAQRKKEKEAKMRAGGGGRNKAAKAQTAAAASQQASLEAQAADKIKEEVPTRSSTRIASTSGNAADDADLSGVPAAATSTDKVKKEETISSVPPAPAPSTSTGATPAKAAASEKGKTATSGAASSGAVKLVIGPIPDDYVRPPSKEEPKTELQKMVFQEQPIVLYKADTVILSPVVFKQMKSEELDKISKLGISSALKILQTYMVEYFKAKMKKAKKSAKLAAQGGPAPSPSPAPLSPAVHAAALKTASLPPPTAQTPLKRKADDDLADSAASAKKQAL